MSTTNGRHGSSSADSWRSEDTVRNFDGGMTTPPSKLMSAERQRYAEESQISPGSHIPASRSEVAPWDDPGPGSNNGSSPAVVINSASPQPKTRHIAKGPYIPSKRTLAHAATMPTHAYGQPPQPSEPQFLRTDWQNGYARAVSPDKAQFDDERRPSVASASTVSSNGSSTSRAQAIHRKLQGIFGEELPANDGRDASQQSFGSQQTIADDQNLDRLPRPSFGRKGSSIHAISTKGSRQASPDASRPRTPQQPSSEVTPWMYQSREDIDHYGDAPIRDTINEEERVTSNAQSHRFQFPRHRTNKSTDDSPPTWTEDPPPPHVPLHKTETFPSMPVRNQPQQIHPMRSQRTLNSSSQSPHRGAHLPDSNDGASSRQQDGQDSGSGGKRSLLDRLRHRNKNDRTEPAKQTSASSSPMSRHQTKASDSSINVNTSRKGSIADDETSRRKASQAPGKGGTSGRLPFKSKKGGSSDIPEISAPSNPRGVPNSSALWDLDTDLSHMEGIVSKDQPNQTPPGPNAPKGLPISDPEKDEAVAEGQIGSWDAPDSWAVRRQPNESGTKLQNIKESAPASEDEDNGVPYFLRIFRPDGTFATLSIGINSTAADVLQLLAKKALLQDEVQNYHIILKKHETSRQLGPSERPLLIQKRLLEQAGYTKTDHIDELGRDDHSYLCRFTFLSSKQIGYSSLEKDPGFNKMQKFSTIDLSSRNLITIPIALYQKSSEIVCLNISKNLNLDVPKDFIQGCTSLREIKFTGNEAVRLPLSFSLASKLTVLDVSNNRLEQLDSANLEKLENLASLKLSNNRLKFIPQEFSRFKSLRSMNVSSNFLLDLPSCICDIKSLVEMDISFNSISSLPHIGKLENLERLWATNNFLSDHPEDTISNLRSLREMDVRFNCIENINILSQLPQLEHLAAGHNNITTFEGSFAKIRTLYLDHNPVTRFEIGSPVPTLTALSLASGKLADVSDKLLQNVTSLTRLILNKNHLVSMSSQIGNLQKLDYLGVAKNLLSTLPSDIGRLGELRFLDVRENNINFLPQEIWLCRKLETLNVSSNVLDSFPKPPSQTALAALEANCMNGMPIALQRTATADTSGEETDTLGDFGPQTRRPSVASGNQSLGSSPATSQRKGSLASLYGQSPNRKLSRAPTDASVGSSGPTRKESVVNNRITSTFAGSLRHVYMADNRLGDEVFDALAVLQELRTVNLSYNEFYEVPPRSIRRWTHLVELYLSGNDLTSLPADEFEDCPGLRVLHINSNKFQVLPADLGKAQKLTILDASSNTLKYNVSNWPYDWNWNCNPHLKYLSLSGNKRLEIKPSANFNAGREMSSLTDFNTLQHLRVLGLMDVTLMVDQVPDETENRRVRTSGSSVGAMPYGIADCLGRNDQLSTVDIVVPKVEGQDDETLLGLFDGLPQSTGGSKIAKFLQENFYDVFREELRRKSSEESATEALRRTYLALNKELASFGLQNAEAKEQRRGAQLVQKGRITSHSFTASDLTSGCAATVIYLHGMDLYVSNVGDVQALLVQSEGGHRVVTQKHDPADAAGRKRIREAGGYVSKQGKLNDVLDVSRAFGFTQYAPAVIAAPYTQQVSIQESDEMIILATRELWDYLTMDYAVDLARSERGDLMRAAQKLRDLAIAFGASGKITVMIIGVSDVLRRRERARYRTHSMSMGPSGLPDEYMASRRKGRGRDATLDSKLARLDQEVEAPTGDVTLVFTDIKNSTVLWETYPTAMRSAIKQHNETMRRHLRLIGGYEVKTEGDAFMVAFPTVTSALLWAFTIQSQLLEVPWPQEIVSSVNGQEVVDADGTVLFRGLSVRMGIHWGQPVWEVDPVTRRMDYFGPMVNRSARIQGIADGGQITVSADFISEVQRLLETHIESDRSNSTGSDTTLDDDPMAQTIRRELRSLSSHGFEVKDLGEKRLKGLENPEYVYLMYPHSLAGRILIQQQRQEAEEASSDRAGMSRDSQLTFDLNSVWELWSVSLRLEMLCSSLENPEAAELKAPETQLLERTRERGGEVTDRFLLNFVEHQVSRIETCITSLALRNLMRPFNQGILQQACPMTDIFAELKAQMEELQTLKQQVEIDIAPS
ncbi:MAG: cysteinyl-tRNA synthetase [Chrysothrix sp. TS-e1954]|nr:MAG: cysteinyl-tRNA synthetase [Chrysothrix sp. TS-e1954]